MRAFKVGDRVRIYHSPLYGQRHKGMLGLVVNKDSNWKGYNVQVLDEPKIVKYLYDYELKLDNSHIIKERLGIK